MTSALLACIAPRPDLAGYKSHGCRCDECHAAHLEYTRRQRRLAAYGQWQPFVDATPAREHAQHLHRTCYSVPRIAELAGVGYATVNTLIWPRNGQPRTRIRRRVADAILAVQPDPALIADGRQVDATVTHRFIQAGATAGWSLADQSRRLGKDRHFAGTILGQQQVTAGTARAVQRLIAVLVTQPLHSKAGDRAKRLAAREGWVPLAAWDDITNPADQPHHVDTDLNAVDEVLVGRAAAEHASIGDLNPAEQVELWRVWRRHRIANFEPYGTAKFADQFGITRADADRLQYAATKAAQSCTTTDHYALTA